MSQALQRHDLSDHHWSLLEGHLPGRTGAWGGVAHDNRQFINAVLWVFRTGSPWRDLPPAYGDWPNIHRRFCRWRDKGFGRSCLRSSRMSLALSGWWSTLPIARYTNMPQVPEGAIRRWGVQRRGNTKVYLAVDAHGMPLEKQLLQHGVSGLQPGRQSDCRQRLWQRWHRAHGTSAKHADTDTTSKKTANINVSTTSTCTVSAVWWKTLLPISVNGEALRHAMSKTLLPLSLPSISDAWSCGWKSHAYT